jgi:hypothetical protein
VPGWSPPGLRSLLKECDWQVPCNVTADSFIVWRNRQTCSPRTLNHYLQGMISFLNWMEKAGRIKTNPLKNVPGPMSAANRSGCAGPSRMRIAQAGGRVGRSGHHLFHRRADGIAARGIEANDLG